MGAGGGYGWGGEGGGDTCSAAATLMLHRVHMQVLLLWGWLASPGSSTGQCCAWKVTSEVQPLPACTWQHSYSTCVEEHSLAPRPLTAPPLLPPLQLRCGTVSGVHCDDNCACPPSAQICDARDDKCKVGRVCCRGHHPFWLRLQLAGGRACASVFGILGPRPAQLCATCTAAHILA